MQDPTPGIHASIAEDAAVLTASDTNLMRLSTKCNELVVLTKQVADAEAALEQLKEQKRELSQKVLPDLFDEIHTDRFGLPDSNLDVVVESYYHAAIKADWPDEQRELAFRNLEACGGGELIRCDLIVSLGARQIETARVLQRLLFLLQDTVSDVDVFDLVDFLRPLRNSDAFVEAPVRIKQDVPWTTLTAWLKEWHGQYEDKLLAVDATANDGAAIQELEALPKPDLSLINGTVGRVCRIKERKRPKRGR